MGKKGNLRALICLKINLVKFTYSRARLEVPTLFHHFLLVITGSLPGQ